MRISTACWCYLVCGAALIAVPAATSADDEGNIAVRAPAPPAIVLEKKIDERNPRALARTLSGLLGVEVRLPLKGFPRVVIPPGDWTATQMLNHVAKQIKGTGWQPVFQFTKRTPGATPVAKPLSKMPSAGRITLEARDVSFPRAIRLIQEAAACVAEVPDRAPAGRFRLSWQDAPVETALKELADQVNMEVALVVRLVRDDDDTEAKRSEDNLARANEETQQQSHVANRLQEAYGQDPYGEDFPWENIDREGVMRTLAREMDLSPADVDSLMERIRLDARSRAELRQGE